MKTLTAPIMVMMQSRATMLLKKHHEGVRGLDFRRNEWVAVDASYS